MKKLIILIVLLCTSPLWAADYYINQAGTGGGTSCNDAKAYTWFNTQASWGAGAGQIKAGDTVHLCGIIDTSASEYHDLLVWGSGTNGNPITIKWESGAKLRQTVNSNCTTNGSWTFIGSAGSGGNYVVIDGGDNGIIENTQNGTNLTYQCKPGPAINMSGNNNVEITNLTIQNLYVAVAPADETGGTANGWDGSYAQAIYINGGHDIKIHKNNFNYVHSAMIVSLDDGSSGATNLLIYDNIFNNYTHAINFGGSQPLGHSGIYVYNNTFGSTVIWDTTGNIWHHDGIHLYHGLCVTCIVSGIRIYNNTFNGDWGAHTTSQIYLEGKQGSTVSCNGNDEGGISDIWVYNNVFAYNAQSYTGLNNGQLLMRGCGMKVYNNTFLCPVGDFQTHGALVVGASYVLADGGMVVNNLFNGCNIGVAVATGNTAVDPSYFDYNAFVNCTNVGMSGGSLTLSQLQAAVTGGSNSSTLSNAYLNSDGTLTSSTPNPPKWAGTTTLTSTDKAGNAWHSPASRGAYEYGSSGPGDTTAPTVTITTSNSTITTDSLTVTGTATDAVGVSGIKFRIGSQPDATHGTACTGTTSWSCSTSGYSSGSNTLYVSGYDAAGNYTSTGNSITVTYNIPTVSGVLSGGSISGGSLR